MVRRGSRRTWARVQFGQYLDELKREDVISSSLMKLPSPFKRTLRCFRRGPCHQPRGDVDRHCLIHFQKRGARGCQGAWHGGVWISTRERDAVDELCVRCKCWDVPLPCSPACHTVGNLNFIRINSLKHGAIQLSPTNKKKEERRLERQLQDAGLTQHRAHAGGLRPTHHSPTAS